MLDAQPAPGLRVSMFMKGCPLPIWLKWHRIDASFEGKTADSAVTTDTAALARGQWMTDALASLVASGTITQAQADAVRDCPGRGPTRA